MRPILCPSHMLPDVISKTSPQLQHRRCCWVRSTASCIYMQQETCRRSAGAGSKAPSEHPATAYVAQSEKLPAQQLNQTEACRCRPFIETHESFARILARNRPQIHSQRQTRSIQHRPHPTLPSKHGCSCSSCQQRRQHSHNARSGRWR